MEIHQIWKNKIYEKLKNKEQKLTQLVNFCYDFVSINQRHSHITLFVLMNVFVYWYLRWYQYSQAIYYIKLTLHQFVSKFNKPMGNCQNDGNIISELGGDQSQGHLMNHWKNMPSNSKRRTFQQQLHRANFQQTLKIYKKSSYSSGKTASRGSSQQSQRTSSTVMSDYRPLNEKYIYELTEIKEHKNQLDKIGYNAISNGEVAVFIMAASNAPELKIDIPLGIYDIGIDSACAIFDILIYRLLNLSKMLQLQQSKRIKVYIMTSSQNKDSIKQYFKKKQYFHYGSKNVFFFSQPVEPIVDEHGKIVLKSQDKIYMGPRGNGCIYQQIKQKKLVQHLQEQNVKYCYFCPTNNLLLKIADPCSLGLLIKERKDIAAGCFKSNDDCFGYYGMDENNKVKIYEERIAVEGRKWANTATCWLTLEFLRNIINNNNFMSKISQYSHDIVREATVFNTALNTLCTQKCLYFESFYHDAFILTQKILIFEIQPQEQFAPIKFSGNGKYSISYAKQQLWKMHRKIIESAGVTLVGEGHAQIHPALVCEEMEQFKEILKAKINGQQLKIPVLII